MDSNITPDKKLVNPATTKLTIEKKNAQTRQENKFLGKYLIKWHCWMACNGNRMVCGRVVTTLCSLSCFSVR